jgi:hypothetical protein
MYVCMYVCITHFCIDSQAPFAKTSPNNSLPQLVVHEQELLFWFLSNSPDAKPKLTSSNLPSVDSWRFCGTKNTTAAPRAVTAQVKTVPDSPCITTDWPSNIFATHTNTNDHGFNLWASCSRSRAIVVGWCCGCLCLACLGRMHVMQGVACCSCLCRRVFNRLHI